MTVSWHVVFTAPHRERRAASDLCCLDGVEGFCPSSRVRFFRRGRIVERPAPLLAGVAFARWEADDPHLWHDVRGTADVTGILGGEFPRPIRCDAAFDLWLRSADDEWCVPGVALALARMRRGYWEGSTVSISHRGLTGVLGVVVRIDEDTLTASVRYDLMGRPQRLDRCPLTDLSAVEADAAALV